MPTAFAMPTNQPTHAISADQRRAAQRAKGQQDGFNLGEMRIDAQDTGREAGYNIYLYNILDREHLVQQPPLFPGLIIPACPKGQKFSYTQLPAFVKEPYCKPGTSEFFYKEVDGRKCASSLLNPSAFPGIEWKAQQWNWDQGDQYGNNLNVLGCWWSLTRPDEEPRLEKEIAIFRKIVDATMNQFIRSGETFAAAGDLKSITPWHHFAMDYHGKQAPWHMTMRHTVTCPNCGDNIMEGIAYHRNSFGEKCIIDRARYFMSIGEVDPHAEKVAKAPKAAKAPETPDPDPDADLNSAPATTLAKRRPAKKKGAEAKIKRSS